MNKSYFYLKSICYDLALSKEYERNKKKTKNFTRTKRRKKKERRVSRVMNNIPNGNNSTNTTAIEEKKKKKKKKERFFINICMCRIIKTCLQSTHYVIVLVEMHCEPL